ncbi:hypothetical protein K503DRAFT_783558 [Rhizopogon vinicolor AM-OR11-026]|uniref:Uncharacterized protein n=1 Tax=Rhizopogon vinicolor AM-OR11-026 TaxID=1314800 RepID=A0A1B7MY44_9AGAM|nr:hypothetical protein K503DRAFT_783558 [Rhizopogon vinicolor AM-OR11-026]
MYGLRTHLNPVFNSFVVVIDILDSLTGSPFKKRWYLMIIRALTIRPFCWAHHDFWIHSLRREATSTIKHFHRFPRFAVTCDIADMDWQIEPKNKVQDVCPIPTEIAPGMIEAYEFAARWRQ